MVRLGEERTTGTFNATGPEPPLTIGELLETCNRVGGAAAELVWVDEGFLLEREVEPWMELPLWLPEEDRWLEEADVSRALAAGLRFHPLEETVRDTLAWARENSAALVTAGGNGTAGMEPAREAELLAAWHAR
jgi:2'-hydroxyisoflavone reductase